MSIPATAQGVLGIIYGRVVDEVDGGPVLSARVTAANRDSGESFHSGVSTDGSFSLVLLPPGTYDVSVAAQPEYRSVLVKGLDVPVAGFLRRDFSLSLLVDIWQSGLSRTSVSRDRKTVLQFYGPDVDTSRFHVVDSAAAVRGYLEPSITDVVSAGFLDRLPLAGRDVYELIALQPGASNDLATVRSTGVSVNGQRPSASSFLLDGRENNNYLITGPFAPLPPEAVAEYRVATNNFAAEYGRTSGYLANAVTHRGTEIWHGMVYGYGAGDWSNASPSQQSSGIEIGARVTGPLTSRHIFTSSLFDFARDRVDNDPVTYVLPTSQFIDSLDRSTAAWKVLDRFRPPVAGGAGQTQAVDLVSTSTSRRITALERVDWIPSSVHRINASVSDSRQALPDFFWSPYPDYVFGLHQDAFAAGGSYNRQFKRVTAEFRAAVSRDSLGWDHPQPDIPQLGAGGVSLPRAAAGYFLRNRGVTVATAANFLVSTPRHVLKWGGGWIAHTLSGEITIPAGNLAYNFDNLDTFAKDLPNSVSYSATRHLAVRNQYADPDMSRRYRYLQAYAFVQDSFHVSRRLLLHYGLRYDYLGTPANVGAQKDALIGLGPGANLFSKLQGADFQPFPSGKQPLYSADSNDAAVRTGFAWNLRAAGDTILRGSYGLFYDRPFDNLWLNLRFNDAVPASTKLDATKVDYLATPLQQVLQGRQISPNLQLYPLTLYQPGIRTPYVHSFFTGVQHRISDSLMLDVNYAGSLGRKLLTTDKVNRTRSIPGCNPINTNQCRISSELNADLEYRGNQGSSAYHGLVSSLRFRHRSGEARLSYTYSHAIDNQSDPLTGLLAHNLQLTRPSSRPLNPRPAAFTVQFDSSADRGSADFDQRHSVVFYSYFNLPSPGRGAWKSVLGGWSLAGIGAIRTGSPFTAYSEFSPDPIHYNRANVIDPAILKANTGPVNGGRILLNRAAFSNADTGKLGTAGRNAFAGPGSYNFDLSASRALRVFPSREGLLLFLRVDAYNFLNHVNLANPLPNELFLDEPNFSLAPRSRTGSASGLLSAVPLGESARRLQLMLRLVF